MPSWTDGGSMFNDSSFFMFIQYPHQLQNLADKALRLGFEACASDLSHLSAGNHCSSVGRDQYRADEGRLVSQREPLRRSLCVARSCTQEGLSRW